MEKYKEVIKKILFERIEVSDLNDIYDISTPDFNENGISVKFRYEYREEYYIERATIYNSELNAYMFEELNTIKLC